MELLLAGAIDPPFIPSSVDSGVQLESLEHVGENSEHMSENTEQIGESSKHTHTTCNLPQPVLSLTISDGEWDGPDPPSFPGYCYACAWSVCLRNI